MRPVRSMPDEGTAYVRPASSTSSTRVVASVSGTLIVNVVPAPGVERTLICRSIATPGQPASVHSNAVGWTTCDGP